MTIAAKEHESSATKRPMLANSGAMSTFVGAFTVTSKLTGQVYECRFSHMWNGIATRHADTIDTKFYVDGVAHVVGLAHTAFVSVYISKASCPISRPQPDCLKPPKGIAASNTL